MGILKDLKVLYHLTLKPIRGSDHASRLESFYSGQAEAYDDFRKRLLKGRQELYAKLDDLDNLVWVDMGGGTGSNLEYLEGRIQQLQKIYVVDLSKSLLEVARRRMEQRGWNHAEAIEADATQFTPAEGYADIVTFSYSLTMIPDWFAAMDNALRILKPGGRIAVVDFYVSRKFPAEGCRRHGWFTRNFWPVWFGNDNVFPSPDHLPYLQSRFETEALEEQRAKVPYIPFIRTPYYQFIGRKPVDNPTAPAAGDS